MKALIAFIILGIVVATLIEINERIKAKKANSPQDDLTAKRSNSEAVQQCNDPSSCSDCSLLSICDKEEKNKH